MRAGAAMRGYRNGMPAPLLLRHPSSLEHDTGTHPERPARIVAIERALAERDWLGWDVRESPRRRARGRLRRAPRGATSTSLEAAVGARAAGALDADTVVSEGSYRAALHAAGGAAALVDALLGGDGPRFGASLHRPPGPPRAAGARDGLLPVQQRRGRGTAGARSLGRRARADPRLGRPPRQRHQRHLPPRSRRALREHPRVAAVSGHGAGGDVGSGPGEGYTVNLPVPAGIRRRGVVLAGRARRRRARARVPPGPDAHLGRLRRARARPARGLPRDRARATRRWRRACAALADELDVPVGVVLEGGYDLEALAESTVATLEVLGAEDPRTARRSRCTRRPRRPRGGWRGAGRWWASWRAS